MIRSFIEKNQEAYYTVGRLFAVLVFTPLLLYKGLKYDDNILIVLAVMLLLWDGLKLMLQVTQ